MVHNNKSDNSKIDINGNDNNNDNNLQEQIMEEKAAAKIFSLNHISNKFRSNSLNDSKGKIYMI